MAGKTKLLLVACSQEETAKLTENIYRILKKDYGLEDQLEMLLGRRRNEIDPELAKGYRSPLVMDFFPDAEVQVDIGRNDLKDIIRGKHVALIEHLLTPDRKMFPTHPEYSQAVSINDHLMAVRGFLDVISDVEQEILQRTLVVPYLTYVRSHSVEKYQGQGFHQFNSLKRTIDDYSRGGVNAILAIDLHSDKAVQLAREKGMDFHNINPFKSGRSVNPYKLGLDEQKINEVLPRLRPYQERLKKLAEDCKDNLYIVSVDAGTELRVENFAERAFQECNVQQVYAMVAYFDKSRISYDQSVMKFKPFSQINEENVNPKGTYIIIDDMVASLRTAADVAKILKEKGAKRVEVWTSHAVTMPFQHKAANDRTYIDNVVCLDTIPQHPQLNIEYIPASADLLAAELYKVHQKLSAQQ
ncbi:MAG: hypothetical protein AABW48_04935 [Nanoarchaeota archaeon]